MMMPRGGRRLSGSFIMGGDARPRGGREVEMKDGGEYSVMRGELYLAGAWRMGEWEMQSKNNSQEKSRVRSKSKGLLIPRQREEISSLPD